MTSEVLHGRRVEIDGIKSKLNQVTLKINTLSEKPSTSHLAEMYDAWVKQVFYGNKFLERWFFKFFNTGKIVDGAKFMQMILRMNSSKVMSGNWMSGAVNALVGEGSQLEDVIANDGIDKSSYMRATKYFLENLKPWIEDYNKIASESFLGKLADYFDLFEVNENLSLSGFMRHSASDYLYMLNTIGEHEFQIRYVLGRLMYLRALDKDGKDIGSMFDYISFNDDGELKVDEKVSNFKDSDIDTFMLRTRNQLLTLHGNYNLRSSVKANAYVVGSAFVLMRKWVEPSVRRRFELTHYDEYQEKLKAGFYLPTAKYIFSHTLGPVINWIGGMVNENRGNIVEISKWSTLNDTLKEGILKGITELAIIIFALAGSLLLSKGNNDDDDDNRFYSPFLSYLLYRLYCDFSFYYNPRSLSTILRDPLPVLSYMIDVLNIFVLLFSPFEEYRNGLHFVKNKFLDKLLRMIPGLKQIPRFGNIQQEFDAFKNNN